MHDGDAVGPLGFFQQMRREHDRDAVFVADLLQVLPQVAACAGIEAGDGSSSSSSRGRCSMPLASSTRRRRPPESFSTRSRLRSARPSRASISSARVRSSRPPQAVEPAVMDDVFHHGELLVDARRLETRRRAARESHRGSRRRSKPRMLHFALLERNQRREHAEERRLAAAVGAEEGEDFAGRDAQRQVANRLVLAVAMGQMRDVDGGRVGHAVSLYEADECR